MFNLLILTVKGARCQTRVAVCKDFSQRAEYVFWPVLGGCVVLLVCFFCFVFFKHVIV